MIQQYLNILRRWIWLLVLAGIGSGAVAYAVTKDQPPTYVAEARLIIGPGIAGLNPDLNALRTGGQLMRTYAELATTRPVLESVIAELRIDLSSDALKKMIEVKTNEDTQILSVQVQGEDSSQVVIIANALADSIVRLSPAGEGVTNDQLKSDVQTQIEEIKSSINQNKETLKLLEAKLLVTSNIEEKRLLFDQINQERVQQSDAQHILATLYQSYQLSNTNQVKVVEQAVSPQAVASSLLIVTMMASLAGLIIAVSLVLGFEYFDDTIRTVADLTYATNIPILATIARYKRLQGIGRERFVVHALPNSRAAESYRVLSSKLLLSRFQNRVSTNVVNNQSQIALSTDGELTSTLSALHSVVISGTQANENVGEVAANLAVLLAQTGYRVILVDAYLHWPSIHRLFAIPEQRGLADILLLRNLAPKSVIQQLRNFPSKSAKEGVDQGRDVMIKSDLHETTALVTVEWAPGLQILTSGTKPTNPFELLVSPHMADLIKSLEKQADLVIIATSPLLSSADSLILASRADGVVIVARGGKTRRDTMKEIVAALNALNAAILGAILDHHQSGDIPTSPKRDDAPQLMDRRERQAHSIV